jgi:hypothetical protein
VRDLLKIVVYAGIFFAIIAWRGSYRWFKYEPSYPYAQDPFFVKLREHPSKGIVISDNVQLNGGLNLQVVSGKQYFEPDKVVLRGTDGEIDLHCAGDLTIDLEMFMSKVAECFESRPLKEWQQIAKILDLNLVMTKKSIKLDKLQMIAENKDFNLYEISK